MHFATLLSTGGGVLAAFLGNLLVSIQDQYLACCSNSYLMIGVLAKYMDDPLSPEVFTSVAANGTVTTDRQPSFAAGVLQKKTGVPSRNFRGSMHVGALPESFTTQDQLNVGTGIPAYEALRDAFRGLVSAPTTDGAGDFYPIVLSTTLSDLFASPSIFTGAWISDYTLNLKVGTMRRRKEKSGSA